MPSVAPPVTLASGVHRRRVASAVLVVAVLAGVFVMLHDIDTPWADLLRYSGYIALLVTLPGTLVHKALRGTVGSWLGDLALGTALGFVLQLAAWALASMLDVRGWLWLWPVVTLPLLLVGAARRRIVQRPTSPWPLMPLLVVIGSAFLAFLLIFRNYAVPNRLPPSGAEIYPDLLWHMGLAAEARRSFPLLTPQVFGDGPLHYHWFSHAHVAGSSMISGVDQTMVWFRLWWVPVVMVGVLLTAELGRRLSGSAGAGAFAALLGSSTVGWLFWPDILEQNGTISANSPSQLFSIPVSLLAMCALVDVVRRTEGIHWGALALAALGMAGSAGSKASTLPIIVGGIGVAFLAALVLRRQRLLLLGLGVFSFALMVGGLLAVSGGGSGQRPVVGHVLTRLQPYRVLIEGPVSLDKAFIDGLWNAPGVGPVLLVGLLLASSLMIIRNLAFVLPLFHRALRIDLGAWLLAGSCLASVLVYFTLAHGGYSELYFAYGAIPFGSALWAWALHVQIRGDRGRQVVTAITAGIVAVASTWAFFATQGRPLTTEPAPMLANLKAFVTAAVVLLAILGVVTLAAIFGRRFRALSILLPVASVVLVTPHATGAVVPTVYRALHPPAAPAPNVDRQDEAAAGLWIAKHVPEYALMSANIHCLKGTTLKCDSRKWWISGLGGRRVLVEAWNYTPRSVGKGYYDPALFELNQAAFLTPTSQTVKALEDRGVSWMVADTQVGYDAPSPDLSDYGTIRYKNSTVTIYELNR